MEEPDGEMVEYNIDDIIEEGVEDVAQKTEDFSLAKKTEEIPTAQMSPSAEMLYKELCSKNELLRSDTSIFPSYTNLDLPYRVICRQRYHKSGVKQRKQFMKEITEQEALQTHALDGVRLHRVFCNPVLSYPEPAEIIKLTREEYRKLERILAQSD